MTTNAKNLNPGREDSLLTISEFIKLAGDRGKNLWLESNGKGRQRITDGVKRHSLPTRMPGGRVPSGLLEVLVDLFFDGSLLAVDFALNPRDED